MTPEDHARWEEWYREAAQRDLERKIYDECAKEDAMEPICDFCSSPDIVKDYACESFEAFDLQKKGRRMIGTSEGRWASCQICADLIDNNLWEELAQRSYETSGCSPDDPYKEILLSFLRNMHRQFRGN
jgi:hypothetical protein